MGSIATAEDFREAAERESVLPSGLVVVARMAGDRALYHCGLYRQHFWLEQDKLGVVRKRLVQAEPLTIEDMAQANLEAREFQLQANELLLAAILVSPAYADIKDVLNDDDASYLLREFGDLSPEERTLLDFTSGGSGSPEPSEPSTPTDAPESLPESSWASRFLAFVRPIPRRSPK